MERTLAAGQVDEHEVVGQIVYGHIRGLGDQLPDVLGVEGGQVVADVDAPGAGFGPHPVWVVIAAGDRDRTRKAAAALFTGAVAMAADQLRTDSG